MKHLHHRAVEKPCEDCLVGFGAERVREDFPALWTKVHGKQLVYLDNAATRQKPNVGIDSLRRFYCDTCANIHRGVHELSERSTCLYEDARTSVQQFINAADVREIIFVRGRHPDPFS